MARRTERCHDCVHVGRRAPIEVELQLFSVPTIFGNLEISIRGFVRTVRWFKRWCVELEFWSRVPG